MGHGRFQGTRVAAAVISALIPPAVGSCSGDQYANVVFEEYGQDVTCTSGGTCRGADGEIVEGNWVETRAIASTSASAFRPWGTLIWIDWSRGETWVEIELDFPTDTTGEVPLLAAMREYRDGEAVFESDYASGVVHVAPPGQADSLPVAGAFSLSFGSDGPDGERGTDDDAVREIRNGRFELTEVPERGTYDVGYTDHAWSDPSFGFRVDVWVVEEPWDEDHYGAYDEGWDDGSGCSGDSYDDSWDDTYDDDWSDDSSGCEGDTYDDSSDVWGDDTSGCSGDGWDDTTTYDDSSGCEGDTWEGEESGCAIGTGRPDTGCISFLIPFAGILLVRSLLRRHKS